MVALGIGHFHADKARLKYPGRVRRTSESAWFDYPSVNCHARILTYRIRSRTQIRRIETVACMRRQAAAATKHSVKMPQRTLMDCWSGKCLAQRT